MDDKLYQDIVRFYTRSNRKYPADIYEKSEHETINNKKSNFRKRAKPYHVRNGVLMYRNKEVLIRSRLDSILKACHDNEITGGHFGRDKTLGKISERYFWKGMSREVCDYVRKCETCFVANSKMTTDAPPLHSIPVPNKVSEFIFFSLFHTRHYSLAFSVKIMTTGSGTIEPMAVINERICASVDRFNYKVYISFIYINLLQLILNIPLSFQVWSLVGIDIMGPFQESQSGNKYIVAITDHFSKWCEAEAIPDKSALSVANFIFKAVCRLGCMDTLISDQGREFVNSVIDSLMEHFQTDHRITSAYHPQSNGQRERDNRTLKTSLCKLVNEEGNNWDNFIPGILLSYHTSVHASTKFTPFEIMYCRKAKLPMDLKDQKDENFIIDESVDLYINETMHTVRRNLNEKVSQSISAAQDKQKKNYDNRRSRSTKMREGSVVYIKNSKRIHRMGSKMAPLWIGPYTVAKVLTKGRVLLRNDKSRKILKNIYNAATLKVYSNEIHKEKTTFPDDYKKADNCMDSMEIVPSLEQTSVNFANVSAEVKANISAEVKANISAEVEDKISVKSCESDISGRESPSSRSFTPASPAERKLMAETHGLHISKCVYFGNCSKLSKPRRIHRTRGDGNCYFRCISFILTGTEDQHKAVRDCVVKQMLRISDQLERYSNENIGKYLSTSHMNEEGVWATDAEILATANLFGVDINVYADYGCTKEWLTYPSAFSFSKKTETGFYLENDRQHFNVVLSVEYTD